MKLALKIIGVIVLLIALVLVGGGIYLTGFFPKVADAPDIKIEATPERIARGHYLANYVANCIDCHSKRDFTKFAGPIVPGTEGMGGEAFTKVMAGVPGTIYAANITPAGIGDWTDGEILRTITTGVNRDGKALFPLMPFMNFRQMSQEDLYSIIAYIRTLKPIENKVPERELEFPMNFIVKTIPIDAPETFAEMPDRSNKVEYGKYMANVMACIECHTEKVKGQNLPGMEFAGGFKFCLPGGNCVTSANITPDQETGIGAMSKETFLNRFRFYRAAEAKQIAVAPGENNTVMPWTVYANATDEDLEAVYEYLRTLKPVSRKVEKFSGFNPAILQEAAPVDTVSAEAEAMK